MKTELKSGRINAEAQRTQRSAERGINYFLRVPPRSPRLCVSFSLAAWLLCAFALMPSAVRAVTTNNLTALLQQGLFEEQANRNLDAAIADYAALATQFDKDRQLAATAIFRLGECFRAQGKTNEAAAHYQRILRDFPDQTTLATLSQQNLAGMGAEDKNAVFLKRLKLNPALENPDAQLLKKLEGKPTDELIKILPTLLPDSALDDLLRQRNEVQSKRVSLITDYSPTNTVVLKVDATLAELNRQIHEKIGGMMQGLKLRAELSPASSASKKVERTSVSGFGHYSEDDEIRSLQTMLQNSPDLINAPYQGTSSPLNKAAENGWLTVATFLIEHGADVNGGNPSALNTAASAGNRAMVELLLSRGADVNSKYSGDSRGRTPLHTAVEKKFQAVTDVLLANKADVNAQDNDGRSPLILATVYQQVKTIQSLLAAGAKPNLENKDGRTPFSYAAESGSPEIVKMFLAAKADPNGGKVGAPLLAAINNKDVMSAEMLLQAGANPNARNKVDWQINFGGQTYSPSYPITPLYLAVATRQLSLVQLLLKFKADPDDSQSDGRAVIFSALDKPEILQALLDARAKAEVRDEMATTQTGNGSVAVKKTPLLSAAECYDCSNAVAILLEHGADANARDKWGRSALHLGAENLADETVFAALLEHKAEPNVRDQNGETPLDLLKKKIQSLMPHPGGGGGSASFSSNRRGSRNEKSSAEQRAQGEKLIALLRQHGALDELPDFTRIRITRQGVTQPLEVFRKGAQLTNQFTLLETAMRFYSQSQVFLPGQGGQESWRALPFPDFGRIIIRRPSQKIGGKEQEIKVSLLNSSNVVDCAQDVPVEFGDVIEIPESVHALNAGMPNPVQELEWNIRIAPKKEVQPGSFEARLQAAITESSAPNASPYRTTAQCLQKSVQLVVAGETTTFKVNSWKEGFLFSALGKTEARSALRSSSDLSRVTVTRKKNNPAKPAVFTVDVSDASQRNDNLWLQDGDVIEVPEKR